MTRGESTIRTAEATSAKSADSSQAHKQVFADAKDYLSVLQNNFSALSRKQDTLSLPNLQLDAGDSKLPANVREAAAVAAQHYSNLESMTGEKGGIDSYGLMKLSDKVAGKNLGSALGNMADDAMGSVVMLGAGAAFAGGASLVGELGAVAVLGVGGAAVAAVGFGGYMLYDGVKGIVQTVSESHADSSTINQWIR